MLNPAPTKLAAIVAVAGILQAFIGTAAAETLQVRVVDTDRNPVAGVAVFVEEQGSTRQPSPPQAAVMDQRDRAFVPHVLVVQKGADVEFPNSDVFAHHVYSFSKPNHFSLPLYKGTPPAPVRFEHAGIVTLGCNIHDGMLGYILVVETDLYSMTDEQGAVQIDVAGDASRWTVSIWSPRIRDSREPLSQVIEQGDALAATFSLQKKLAPAHKGHSESVSWDDYD